MVTRCRANRTILLSVALALPLVMRPGLARSVQADVSGRPGGAGAVQSELVIHKAGTTVYHRPGCPVIRDGEGVVALPRAQAEAKGYTAHAGCDPARAKPGGARGADAPPPGAETVYVSGPKYYHRKTCRKLGEKPKAMPLEVALKTHWPCPVCKAPILKRTTEPAVPGTNRRKGG